jgi:hypothetical protein
MAKPKLQILVAALLAVLCGSTTLSAQPLNDAEKDEAVAEHNAVRKTVAQEESARLGGTVSIPALTWDPAHRSDRPGMGRVARQSRTAKDVPPLP